MTTRSLELKRVRGPALIGLLIIAFVLRAYSLTWPPLAWDEGWSLAISQLPFADLAYLTARDVHPPGYYLVLRPFLLLGHTEWAIRSLSLLAGVLSVPLAYQAGRAWVGRQRPAADAVGMATAAYVAVAPLLIYYAQVARMYALTVAGVLLATWGVLRCLDSDAPAPSHALAGWAIGALLALYTFYYSALALLAVGAYALWRSRPLWRAAGGRTVIARITAATVVIVVAFVPWLAYAAAAAVDRVEGRLELGGETYRLLDVLSAGVYGSVFAYGPGWLAVATLVVIVIAGALAMTLRRQPALGLSPTLLILPTLAIALTLLGVALGTRAHMFAARYTIPASPFIGLAVAYGVVALWATWPRVALAAAALVLVVTLWPTTEGIVYTKGLERSDSWDPAADARALRAAGAAADDLVVFNVLSLAGAYDAYRTPDMPPWTYAQRWDPVTETMARIEDRLDAATQGHPRVWSVLYKGTAGANAALKARLDRVLYPVSGTWRGDTLTLLHLNRVEPRESVNPGATWADGPLLQEAIYTTHTTPGGAVTVDLKWDTARPLDGDYTVFVHLYDPTGRLVTQHDGPPLGGSRPTSSWAPGRATPDFHGLILPANVAGPLTLRVGLYDPVSGRRLPLADGRDMVDIGTIEIAK